MINDYVVIARSFVAHAAFRSCAGRRPTIERLCCAIGYRIKFRFCGVRSNKFDPFITDWIESESSPNQQFAK
jgi:hypothetical protein